MKQKEIIQLGIAAVILAAVGLLIFSQFGPKKAAVAPQVEKITPIERDFDQESLTALNDRSKNRNFYNEPDLKSGLGNTQPFGSTR